MPSPRQLMDIIGIQTEIAKLGLDLGGVMQLVVERTLPLIGADGAVIEMAEGGEMVYRAAAGSARPHLGLRLQQDSSLSGHCVRTGETLRCDDSESDERVDRQACRLVGLRSMIVMPLTHNQVTVGVLKAMSAQPARFQEAELSLLGLLSELVAAAMFFATKYDADALYQQATHDGLTGLANRSLFMDRLRSVIVQGHRSHAPVGVFMIDMDGLKGVNDTFGHRVGDAVIREFGQRLLRGVRQSDTVARLGGDEFAVILTPMETAEGVEAAVHRLKGEIEPPFLFEGKSYPLRASIGVANFPADGDEAHGLLELADQRMYHIKQKRHRQPAAALH